MNFEATYKGIAEIIEHFKHGKKFILTALLRTRKSSRKKQMIYITPFSAELSLSRMNYL